MTERLRALVKDFTPPILLRAARRLRHRPHRELSEPLAERQPASYYDGVYAASGAYRGPYAESEYYFMWSIVADRLLKANARSVLDLGCGPGQFASLVHDRRGVERYCGIDFSAVSIEIAKEKCPAFQFEQVDLSDPLALDDRDYDWAVALELLEHVDDDVGLLSRLRPGCSVLLTVPNFPDPAHVRVFDSAEAVLHRYGHLFSGARVDTLNLGTDGKQFFLFEGERSIPRR